jgi:hypothetical protein
MRRKLNSALHLLIVGKRDGPAPFCLGLKNMREGEAVKSRWRAVWLLGNPAALFFGVYGLKCLLTGNGMLTEPSHLIMGSFFLVEVTGKAAIITGLGYLAGAVSAFSVGLATVNRSGEWHVLRRIVQWASLFAMLWLFHFAHVLRR